jgi:radical SAM superfamily enzyme YgiQ (UPF0313 family)
VHQYREAIRILHDQGIGIQGSFIFGHDDDPPDSFDQVVDFCQDNKMDAVLFSLLTPFPGTRIFDRFLEEKRLLHFNWDKYDMNHVVFRPKQMTPEALERRFLGAYKKIYSLPSVVNRLFKFNRSLFLFVPMNLSMRNAWKKIFRFEGLSG